MAFGTGSWYNRCMEYIQPIRESSAAKAAVPKKEWCVRVIEDPIRVESQEGNRFRFSGVVEELGGAILRVVTLEDKTTIHNAFPDRRFKRWNCTNILKWIPYISIWLTGRAWRAGKSPRACSSTMMPRAIWWASTSTTPAENSI